MAEPLELRGLYDALEASPGDPVSLRALADWYEEHDEARRASCYRWLAAEHKAPYKYHADSDLRHHHSEWHDGWYWWTTGEKLKDDWGYSAGCALPDRVWKKLRHEFSYNPLVFKEYPTVREALNAVVRVWNERLLLPLKRKASRSASAPARD